MTPAAGIGIDPSTHPSTGGRGKPSGASAGPLSGALDTSAGPMACTRRPPRRNPLSLPPGTDRTPRTGTPQRVHERPIGTPMATPRRRAHNSRRGPIGRSVRTLGRPRKEPLAGCSGRAPLAPIRRLRGDLSQARKGTFGGVVGGLRRGPIGGLRDHSQVRATGPSAGPSTTPPRTDRTLRTDASAGPVKDLSRSPRQALLAPIGRLRADLPRLPEGPSAGSPAGSTGGRSAGFVGPPPPPGKTFGGRPT